MTRRECEQQGYPHNRRERWTHGFYCEDCDEFFPKDSPTYIRYALASDVWMVLWNLGIDMPELNSLHKEEDRDKREAILNKALLIIARHGKTPESASIPIKC